MSSIYGYMILVCNLKLIIQNRLYVIIKSMDGMSVYLYTPIILKSTGVLE